METSSSGAVDGATGQMAGLKLSGAGGAVGADASAAGDADAAQKRIRALQKKLRQIQQLKERCQKEGKWGLKSSLFCMQLCDECSHEHVVIDCADVI